MRAKSLKTYLAVVAISVLALVAVAPSVQAASVSGNSIPFPTPVYADFCAISGPSHLLVFFNLNNQGGLASYLNNAYYNPLSPAYHEFLSAGEFDAQYSAPPWAFYAVSSIMYANGLTIIASGPMLLEANGTDVQVGNALSQLASTPNLQQYIIGAECMPQTYFDQPAPANVPDLARGQYVGNAPYSAPAASSCDYSETTSGGLIWFPCGLQTIYDENPLLSGYHHGAGSMGFGSNPHQTIALVDAYGDLNNYDANLATPVYDNLACSDFGIFDATFDLPSASCQVIYPTGVPVLGPDNVGDAEGWSAETAIDTQYSHVMDPSAHILEVTSSTDYDDLYASVEFVVNHQLANIISLSWGSWEDSFFCVSASYGCAPPVTAAFMMGYNEIFEQAAAEGIGVFASSADYAAYDPNFGAVIPPYGEVSADIPASDPWVSGVGGTTLSATFTGNTVTRSETAWSLGTDSYCLICGTGGGFSLVFPETPGQRSVHISTQVSSISEPALGLTFYPQGQRGVPDLAADADPSSGVLIIQNGTFSPYVWGGTSLATPLTAGMTELIQSTNGWFAFGDLAPTLYQLYSLERGGFYTHSTQFNLGQLSWGVRGTMFETQGGQNGEYYVTPGVWNPVAGLGQLNVYGLAQVISPPFLT